MRPGTIGRKLRARSSRPILKARLRQLLTDIAESFWLVPGGMVLGGLVLALILLRVDRSGALDGWNAGTGWFYDGGGTGARTLLATVASSAIGVAGTVFSITIAALTLAAGQMGPRLLRNFTRDRGNQFTLGAFLGTFSFALMVLRSVRTRSEGEFIPHLSLSVAIAMAFVCVLTLVYFVHHMASRINVDTVVELVGEELRAAMERLTTEAPQTAPPPPAFWRGATAVMDDRQGYLQQFEPEGLADWAQARGIGIRLLIRPGDYVFPGAAIALLTEPRDGAAEAIRAATVMGPHRTSDADLEYAVRQLVEVAVRALSPGINDPYTAISVLDRLAAALCWLAGRGLPTNVFLRDESPALVAPSFDYSGLLDAMFHMIRQSAAGNVSVLIRMLEVLTAVAGCETEESRVGGLRRHARLVLEEAERSVSVSADLADLRGRHADFATMCHAGIHGLIGAAGPGPAGGQH